jgi:hypothetical protein
VNQNERVQDVSARADKERSVIAELSSSLSVERTPFLIAQLDAALSLADVKMIIQLALKSETQFFEAWMGWAETNISRARGIRAEVQKLVDLNGGPEKIVEPR